LNLKKNKKKIEIQLFLMNKRKFVPTKKKQKVKTFKNIPLLRLEPEVKSVDWHHNAVAEGQLVGMPNWIYQGPALNQRIGNRVNVVSIDIQGQVTPTIPLGVPTYNIQNLRVVFVWDRAVNKVLPLRETVFAQQIDTNVDPGILSLWDPINPDNRERFKILYDWKYCCNWMNQVPEIPEFAFVKQTINYQQSTFIDRYIRLHGLQTIYGAVGDGDGFENTISGGLHCWIMTNQDSTRSVLNMEINVRIRYTDC